MTRICMFAIWIGELPNTYELWKQSIFHNPTIDFYFVTDRRGMKGERNLHVITADLTELKEKFQRLCECRITLEYPYKLCDYKPLWGLVFPEIISEYEFWGHLDLDVILGNIRAFLTDDILQKYDKILEAGWFTLYRNCSEMGNLYKRSMDKDNMAYPYKAAFKCKYACYFDEYMGMNILAWTYHHRVLRDQLTENMVQDFGWQTLEFKSYITEDNFVFRWEDGKLYRHLCDTFGRLTEEPAKEYMVVHIQKRKMMLRFTLDELIKEQRFWVVPNRFQLQTPSGELYTEADKADYQGKMRIEDHKRSLRNLKNYGIWNYIPHFLRSRKIRKWIWNEKGFF